MSNPNFKNGQKLDVQSAFAFFVIMMGLLFHIDAVAGVHTVMTLSTILIGVVWFLSRQYYCHHHRYHHHG
ncbi:MAG: hypothetical protein KBT88_00520 [Gammaproteobacteria bacterium]|nr:hypothetical protein [Gammaproteobacteria bacterium]MBQ0838236.1 hypothetical protein [Gammaproteobacteria bacterium]